MGVIIFKSAPDAQDQLEVDDRTSHNISPPAGLNIKMCTLHNVRAGCQFKLFDSPDGNTNDDICIVNVKKLVSEYVIDSFERTYEDETVAVSYIRNNGLKVSLISFR
jgi:hypothetical protein